MIWLDLAAAGRGDRARPAGQVVRESHAQCQRPGKAQRIARLFEPGKHHHELVAAQTRHRIGGTHLGAAAESVPTVADRGTVMVEMAAVARRSWRC